MRHPSRDEDDDRGHEVTWTAGCRSLLLALALSAGANSSAGDKPAPAVLGAAVVRAPASDAGSAAPEAATRGRAVFESHCVTCHGASGKGDGRVARLYNPKPSDLTASTQSDSYKSNIIRKGGASVGRSVIMPAWGGELSDAEIGDLVAYLRLIGPRAVADR
jgi:mono/diheme cytochrome c family protein